MVHPIGMIVFRAGGIDYEYRKIIMELMQLGLKPTGNKATDKARLKNKKQLLIQQVKAKINKKIEKQKIQTKIEAPSESPHVNANLEVELSRVGAMQVADLKKLYFGL